MLYTEVPITGTFKMCLLIPLKLSGPLRASSTDKGETRIILLNSAWLLNAAIITIGVEPAVATTSVLERITLSTKSLISCVYINVV